MEQGKVIKRYRHEDVKTPPATLTQLCDKGLARLKEGGRWRRCRRWPMRKPIWLQPRTCSAPRLRA